MDPNKTKSSTHRKLFDQGLIDETRYMETILKIPSLMEENRFAFEIFERVSDQLIFAPMGGPIGINVCAIETYLNAYRIPKDDDEWLYLIDRINWLYQERERIRKKFTQRKSESQKKGEVKKGGKQH